MKEKPAVEVRLDKWLWAARFYKTRALAREMIEGGKVHYNGQRSKPSKIVELNATLTLRQGNDERTVIVKAITEQRRPASEAALLYEETAESVEKREKMAMARKLNALTMPHPDRRPDKKERRDLLRFKHGRWPRGRSCATACWYTTPTGRSCGGCPLTMTTPRFNSRNWKITLEATSILPLQDYLFSYQSYQ